MSYSRRPTTDREDIDDCLKREFGDLFRDHPEFATRFRLRPTRGFSSQTEEDDFYRDLPGFPDDRFFRSSRPSRFGDGDFGFRHRPGFDDFYGDQYFPSDYRQRSSGAQEGSGNSEHRAEPKAPENLNKPPQAPKTEERSRKPTSNIQQSNTVDLGQKQEPVDDQRNQRSMSAPPDNRSPAGKRYVSSIKIPNLNSGQTGPSGDMGSRQSQPEASSHPQQPQQPQQQSQQTQKPTERIIPIHIEGRDEPIVPKNANVPFSSTPPPQQPQAERIFGQRPSTFTQFLNRGEPQEELLKRQQEEMMREQYQKQQQEYQKQQQENFQRQQQEQQQPQQQQQQQIPKQAEKPTPLDLIQNIQKDVSNLMGKVETFAGKPKDKEYLYLDEMLTRNLLKLDNIETEGKDVIRQARKEAINCIQQTIQILESKAKANEQQLKTKSEDVTAPSDSEPVDTKLKEEKSQEVQEKVEAALATETPQKMDTEENTTEAAEPSDPPAESNKMETSEDKAKMEVKEDVAVKEAEQPTESEAPSQDKTEDSSTEKAKVKKKK